MGSAHNAEVAGIAASLREHPGVEHAVVAVEEDAPGHPVRVAYVVPDRQRAGAVRRACEIEAGGKLDGLSLYEPSPDLLVAQKNRTETDFLYREIVLDDVYFRHGVRLPAQARVVDVGANIGMFSLLAARRSPGARIIAIEPITELSRAVEANAVIHGADITVLNCALGSRAGVTSFTYYPNNTVMSGRFADQQEDRDTLRGYLTTGETELDAAHLDQLVADRMTGQERQCPVMALAQVVAQAGLDRIDLLKIDVEKAEIDVLAGMDEDTWARVRQMVIEVHDVDGRVDEVLEMLRGRGFTATAERDRRLAGTNCFNIYAYREQVQGESQEGRATGPDAWTSRQRLVDDLEATVRRAGSAASVPDHFVLLASIPLTAGGEPDLDELARIRRAREGSVRLDLEPQSAAEQRLAGIWRDIFGISEITVESDFFELGGNSLTAVRLIARVEEAFGQDVLAPDVLFETGKLGALAAAIDSALAQQAATPEHRAES
jgi:FkbM family methyltransferase